MSDTAVVRCSCLHEYQDKRYGNGKRAANRIKPNDKTKQEYRCTVCGTIHRP